MRIFETFVAAQAARFERRAEDREKDGLVAAAAIYRRLAEEMRADWAAWKDQEVTPEEAARLSNYTAHGLRQWMRRTGRSVLTVGVLPFRPADAVASELRTFEPALSEPALSEPALSEPALSEPALSEVTPPGGPESVVPLVVRRRRPRRRPKGPVQESALSAAARARLSVAVGQ